MTDRVLMEQMSWVQIEEAVKSGKTTVIVTCGSIEQHGPHLPTGTDTILGYNTAELLARELGNALVAPVIRPGLSEHHLDFPGSLSLSFETFCKTLEEVCVCLSRYGFKDIVLLSSHGGNTDAMIAYTPIIAKKVKDRSRVHIMAIPPGTPTKAQTAVKGIHEAYGVTPGKAGAHSGWDETSCMLAVAPELVDMSKAAPGRCDEFFYSPNQIRRSQLESFIYGIKYQSPNGILGDATGADAEAGKKLIETRVKALAEQVRALISAYDQA